MPVVALENVFLSDIFPLSTGALDRRAVPALIVEGGAQVPLHLMTQALRQELLERLLLFFLTVVARA